MRLINVSAVILCDSGRILVCKRPDDSYFGGWWEWPGGKREPGETAIECAERELMEEIGLKAVGLRLFDRCRAPYPGREVDVEFFVGLPASGGVAAPDAVEHCWLTPREVLSLRFLEPNLPVLGRLIEAPPPELTAA